MKNDIKTMKDDIPYEYEINCPHLHLDTPIHHGGSTQKLIVEYKHLYVGKLLDLGCASGYHTFFSAEIDTINSVIGIDINKQKIEYGDTQLRRIGTSDDKVKLINDNIFNLKKYIDNESVDIIQMFHAFEHIYVEHQDLLMNLFKYALKKTGHIIIIVPYERNHDSALEHYSWWNENTLKDFFDMYKFDCVECKEIESYQVMGVFKKI